MKKVNIKVHNILYENHYFIKDLKDLNEYHDILGNAFKVSESEIKNNKSWVGHGHSLLTGIAGIGPNGMIENIEDRDPMLFNLKLLQAKLLTHQLQYVLEGRYLVANDKMGYFPIKPTDSYEIQEIEDKLFYTENDIEINKWWGGNHYYAKVAGIDVIDDNGNVKWNTSDYARSMAIKFLEKINK